MQNHCQGAVWSGRPLKTDVSTESEYRRFWTAWVNNGEGEHQPKKQRTRSPLSGNADSSTQAEVKRLQALVSKTQSEKDKQIAELRRLLREAGGRGNGSGGKGQGRGKGHKR